MVKFHGYNYPKLFPNLKSNLNCYPTSRFSCRYPLSKKSTLVTQVTFTTRPQSPYKDSVQIKHEILSKKVRRQNASFDSDTTNRVKATQYKGIAQKRPMLSNIIRITNTWVNRKSTLHFIRNPGTKKTKPTRFAKPITKDTISVE